MKQILYWHLALVTTMSGLSGCNTSEQELRYSAGRVISAEMLRNLVDQQSEYSIALVSATLGRALLLSSPGETPQAESIEGHEDWVWAQAAGQLSGADQMSLQIARTQLDSGNCPALPQALNVFFATAEPLLVSQFNRFPAREEISAAVTRANEEIIIDGPAYRLHVVAADATITYDIASRTDGALLQAVTTLSSSIGKCTSGLEPEIELIYGLE